jgi:hypothetical protein
MDNLAQLTSPKAATTAAYESQADRIISKFGGVTAIREALKAVGKPFSKIAVYRWTYTKSATRQGTGGLVPADIMPYVLKAARMVGVVLMADDLDPRPTPLEPKAPKRRLSNNATIEKQRKKKHVDMSNAVELPVVATDASVDIAVALFGGDSDQ